MRPKLKSLIGIAAATSIALTSQTAYAKTSPQPLKDLSSHKVDKPQLRSAVASRTLTWLTGGSAENDYISVGRLANFFGFVALRVSSGQSLTRAHVARDTLDLLEPSQIQSLADLLQDQTAAHQKTQSARLQMNRALEKLLAGESVSQSEFLKVGRAYGAAEAELGQVIAARFGAIAQTLSDDQHEGLQQIRIAHASGQPERIKRPSNRATLPDVDRQELVNLAARFLSWTTGSPKLNDFEVVGKPSQHFGFVSLRLASGHSVKRGAVSQEVLELLNGDQRRMLEKSVDQNVKDFGAFLAARAKLMRTLEVALSGQKIDSTSVARYGAQVGELEAKMTWAQATAMLEVRDSLSQDQTNELLAMRAKYTASDVQHASANPIETGRKLFAQCALCHVSTRGSAIAPDLEGIVGRQIANDRGFGGYSPAIEAFANKHGVWSEALLDSFLRSPRTAIPGTTMGFDGFASQQDRAAIVAYLKSLSQ